MGRSKKAGGNRPRVNKRDFRDGRKDEWQPRKTPRLDSTAFDAEKNLQNEEGYAGKDHILQSDAFEEYYKVRGPRRAAADRRAAPGALLCGQDASSPFLAPCP